MIFTGSTDDVEKKHERNDCITINVFSVPFNRIDYLSIYTEHIQNFLCGIRIVTDCSAKVGWVSFTSWDVSTMSSRMSIVR